MIIAALKETAPFETRVALTPQTSTRFIEAGFTVMIEQGAGLKATFDDEAYRNAGVLIKPTALEVLKQTDILLKVQSPSNEEINHLKAQSFIIGNLQNLSPEAIRLLQSKDLTCLGLENLPRISRAQAFDILSSQNNLAGYQAVIKSASFSSRIFPLMITSAGTLPPLKFLIIGIGVAGLQAIATAKRLGGKVFAADTRAETREQAQSLGAGFTTDIAATAKESDIIITSAFSTGKKAPLIITPEILKTLRPNTLLIDMAAGFGGNIAGSQNFELVRSFGCLIYGNNNLAAEVPASASILFANNLCNFILAFSASGNFAPDFNDNLLTPTLITKG